MASLISEYLRKFLIKIEELNGVEELM